MNSCIINPDQDGKTAIPVYGGFCRAVQGIECVSPGASVKRTSSRRWARGPFASTEARCATRRDQLRGPPSYAGTPYQELLRETSQNCVILLPYYLDVLALSASAAIPGDFDRGFGAPSRAPDGSRPGKFAVDCRRAAAAGQGRAHLFRPSARAVRRETSHHHNTARLRKSPCGLLYAECPEQ
jgi:hypothetical protein